ncbi:extracellular solute-binding protein [Hoeflea sp. G2-23]|uniref:Extracellular solute-binding protein n=1 Tax=Hoeflea algicola TaxID=2983763 RepID=A0ABT3ZBF7_9HYPH|nr:extracellular solute-binding protein [Hoeflea algicola]MCY0148581.1 extracellular solute-binding protein [Hoeflea algicola]
MNKGKPGSGADHLRSRMGAAVGWTGANAMLSINKGGSDARKQPVSQCEKTELLNVVAFLEDLEDELSDASMAFAPNPYIRMSLHLIRSHLEAKTVTPTSLIGVSGIPYATASRRIREMLDDGLIEQRPRTRSGKTFSMHPSEKLLESWMQLTGRLQRIAENRFGKKGAHADNHEYYFGGSYMQASSIPPLQVLPEPLRVPGGIRVLVHGDPTFMVMDNLKRQFEQVVGTDIHQRAFSIDRLHQEALKNAERKSSRYDIIAVDLPWIGEFAEKNVLMPLDEALDIARLDPADFHTAGWKAAHWGGRPYGVPAQTTPELLFYRKDLFAESGLEPPVTTHDVIDAARSFHDPQHGFYGIAWNAARGTALGHTFLMTLADFGQPLVDLPPAAGGFNTDRLDADEHRMMIDSDAGLAAAEYLMELLSYSPPYILSMSWYERIRPYAAGEVAMAYGYTLLAPYFELDPSSPAHGQTGFLPHPAGPSASPVAPVGGYVMGIPRNLAPERIAAAAEALIVFTSPEAQKLFIQNGSRTNPRYSVAADPEVRRESSIFEAVDAMSWRDELQFWPRPPIPEIGEIVQICGEEFHDMLRGIIPPKTALHNAQKRADDAMRKRFKT